MRASGDFFKDLFGFAERGYSETQDSFAVEGSELVVNGRRFHVGSFDCLTLKALRDRAISQQRSVAKQTSGVTVTHVLNLDTVAEHAKPENSGATFQVASQFNCLEFTSRKNTPEMGISKYAGDDSQGPKCAIACAPAAVYRNYFVPMHGKRGQTTDNQINNLDEVERRLDNSSRRFFEFKNGYVDSSPSQLLKLKDAIEGLSDRGRDELRDAVKVGLHSGVDVVFNAEEHGTFMLVPPERVHQIHQVLCSGLSVSTFNTSPDDWEVFARLVLEGVYEATLWAAVACASEATKASATSLKPRVNLTFVGAGAFANPLEWVVDAINRALNKVEEAGVGLEVIVNHWRHVDPQLERAIRVGAPPIGEARMWICPNCSTPYSMMFVAKCKWDGARRPDESKRPSDSRQISASCPPRGARRPDESTRASDPRQVSASCSPRGARKPDEPASSSDPRQISASCTPHVTKKLDEPTYPSDPRQDSASCSPPGARKPDEAATSSDPRQVSVSCAHGTKKPDEPTRPGDPRDHVHASRSPGGARSLDEHARPSDPRGIVAPCSSHGAIRPDKNAKPRDIRRIAAAGSCFAESRQGMDDESTQRPGFCARLCRSLTMRN